MLAVDSEFRGKGIGMQLRQVPFSEAPGKAY